MTAIVTAIYGGHDTLKPARPTAGTDWVLVTDRMPDDPMGWRVILDPSDAHPNLAAKTPKCLPMRYTTHGRSVWVDASFRVVGDLTELRSPLGQFPHPERDCIYEEARAAASLARYADLPIMEQADYYRAEHPAHWGLWETGVIVREHSEVMEKFGRAWLDEMVLWGYHDQISETVICGRLGLRPETFIGTSRENPWLSYEPSEAHG